MMSPIWKFTLICMGIAFVLFIIGIIEIIRKNNQKPTNPSTQNKQ